MVGLGNKQPVSASFGRKNIFTEVNAVESGSADLESESGRSSEISSSINSSCVITVDKNRQGYEALQALVSAASKDEKSVHLNLDGRGSLNAVICTTKEEIMKIDETIEILTPSAGNLPSSSSVVNHEDNGKAEEKTMTEIIPEKESEVLSSVQNLPDMNEVKEELVSDAKNYIRQNNDNKSTDTGKQVVAMELLGELVEELVHVEGYVDETWGSAVEVENGDFYPTLSSRPLEADEYQKFLEESEDEGSGSERQEFVTCVETQSESASGNTSLASQVDELQHEEVVLKCVNQPESITNGVEMEDLEENPPKSKPNELPIVDPEENLSESRPTELSIVNHEENLSENRSPELSIVNPEENLPESRSTVLSIMNPEETRSESRSTELSIVNPEEYLPESRSAVLSIINPEENLAESKPKELPIVDPEENRSQGNFNELGIANLEANPPVKDGCYPTDTVQPEASGDTLLNTGFDKIEEITDDYILNVFINDDEDKSLVNDCKMEFGNVTESASPANENLVETDNSKLQEKEQTVEDISCLNLDTEIATVLGHEADSAPCIVSTNDEQPEHVAVQEAQVMETEKDETPAEKWAQNIDSINGSPISSVSSNRGSVRDPRLRRRTRSFEDSASQVSVASTSSSHSSVRPCSVILTRVDASPSQSPVRSNIKTKPVEVASPSRKSNSIITEKSMEHEQSVGEPQLDGCDDKNENKPLVTAPNFMRDKSSEDAANVTPLNGPCTKDTNPSVEDVDMEDEPIRLYEPINLDDPSDPVKNEAISNKTEEIMEAAPDVSSEPVRTTRKRKSSAKAAPDVSSEPVRSTRKRKSSAKAAETEAVKKGCPSSLKRESTEKPGKLLSAMSKNEIMAFIKKESRKTQPDFTKLSEAMDITYDPTRKVMYDNGQVDVEIIRKKHPELLHYQMVKNELGRILKDPAKMVRLEKELSEEVLTSALEGKKKTSFPSKKRHPLWQKTIKLWAENKGSESSTQYQRVLGMLAVCFEFSENAVVNKLCTILKQNGTLSKSDTEKMDTPTIVVKESELFSVVEEADIWIYVDGEKYIKVPNMYEAVLSVFAAYYIFNITYDKSLKSLFEFFDYLCDNRQSTYKSTAKKWPPELRIGVKEFPVLDP